MYYKQCTPPSGTAKCDLTLAQSSLSRDQEKIVGMQHRVEEREQVVKDAQAEMEKLAGSAAWWEKQAAKAAKLAGHLGWVSDQAHKAVKDALQNATQEDASTAKAKYTAALKIKDEKALHSTAENAKAAKAKQAYDNAKDHLAEARRNVEAQIKKVQHWMEAVGKAKKWKVVYKGTVNVRQSPSVDAEILKTKFTGALIHGMRMGSWVMLSGEPGYIKISFPDTTILEEVQDQKIQKEEDEGSQSQEQSRATNKSAHSMGGDESESADLFVSGDGDSGSASNDLIIGNFPGSDGADVSI